MLIAVLADRDSDILEAFAYRQAWVDLLLRAAQDRSLEDVGRLFAQADVLVPAARATLERPAKPGRRARQAVMAVRYMSAELARPQNGKFADAPKR